MKKIIICLLFVFLLTGCSVTYDLQINKDGTVTEEVYFLENNDVLLNHGKNLDDAFSNIKNFYLSGDNNIEPEIIIKNDNSKRKESNNHSYYGLSKNIKNIDDYSKTLFFNYYFDSSSIYEKDDTVTIYAVGFNWDNVLKLTQEYKYKFDFDKVNIRIKLDNKVVNTNATKIDYEDNIYYFEITKDDADFFELSLTYEKENFHDSYYENVSTFENVTSSIVEFVSGGRVDGVKYVKDNKVTIIVIVGVILVLIVGLIFFFRKKIADSNKI